MFLMTNPFVQRVGKRAFLLEREFGGLASDTSPAQDYRAGR